MESTRKTWEKATWLHTGWWSCTHTGRWKKVAERWLEDESMRTCYILSVVQNPDQPKNKHWWLDDCCGLRVVNKYFPTPVWYYCRTKWWILNVRIRGSCILSHSIHEDTEWIKTPQGTNLKPLKSTLSGLVDKTTQSWWMSVSMALSWMAHSRRSVCLLSKIGQLRRYTTYLQKKPREPVNYRGILD